MCGKRFVASGMMSVLLGGCVAPALMGGSGGNASPREDGCEIAETCRAQLGGGLDGVGVGLLSAAVIGGIAALIAHDVQTARPRTPAVRRTGYGVR